MRRKTRNEILVGSFICVGLSLFALLLFLMGTLDPLLGRNVTVEVDFENVQGLQVGDPVYVFGMRAGKVTRVSLLPRGEAPRAIIRVEFSLPSRLRDYLRVDSAVKIDKSLTGSISMAIAEGEGRSLPAGGRLAGSRSADLASLGDKVQAVLGEGEVAVRALNRLLEELHSEGSLSRGVEDAAEIARTLRTELEPLGPKLREVVDLLREMLAENRDGIRDTVANLQRSSDLVRSLSAKLQPIPEALGGSLAELERAGREVGGVVRRNRERIDMILDDLRESATSAASLTAEIKRRPWRLLYRPSEAEKKALELYDAAWAYNLGATELNRSVRELSERISGEESASESAEALRVACEQIRESLARQKEAEEIFWERLRQSD